MRKVHVAHSPTQSEGIHRTSAIPVSTLRRNSVDIRRAAFMQSRTTKVLGFLVFAATVFPYLTPIPTPFDTQPYALVAAILLVTHALTSLRLDLQIPRPVVVFAFVAAIAIVHFVTQVPSLGSLRSLVGYISIVVISLAAYYSFLAVRPKVFVAFVFVWLAVATLQILVTRDFGSVVLSRMSTSVERGITALAVEPSYFAICCVFMLMVNDVLAMNDGYGRRVHRLVLVLLVLQIFMAASALGFLLLLVYLGALLIAQRKVLGWVRVFGLGALFTVAGAVAFAVVPSLAEGRAFSLTGRLAEHPETLIYADGSIANRLLDVLVAPMGLVASNGIGFGLDSWILREESVIQGAGHFVQSLAAVDPGGVSVRLMSGWGAAIFELGIFGILLLAAYALLAVEAVRRARDIKQKQVALSSALTTFVLLIVAVPLAFPFFGYFIGILFLFADGRFVGGANNAASSSGLFLREK